MSLNRVERWRDVEGYEGIYQVSNLGNVKSLNKKVWNGRAWANRKEKILSKTKTTTGYYKVELTKNGKRKSYKVHRLVGFAFIKNKKRRPNINHIDGNPLNNNVKNLEWCNQKENMEHATKSGLLNSEFGENRDLILNEYLSDKDTNIKKMSRKYNCSDSSIRKYFKRKGINIRGISEAQDIYKVDREKMIKMFEEGKSNKVIALYFNTNNALIGTYRYKNKKGELKI